MELESMADPTEKSGYHFHLSETNSLIEVDCRPMWNQLCSDIMGGTAPATISARFHNGLAEAGVQVALALRELEGINDVVLGGGVFANAYLLQRQRDLLEAADFCVWFNQRVPINDGGIAFGQAAVAAAVLRERLGVRSCA